LMGQEAKPYECQQGLHFSWPPLANHVLLPTSKYTIKKENLSLAHALTHAIFPPNSLTDLVVNKERKQAN
jgi:hypothetical protein